ncbi:hypothetical protein [Salinibacter phage M8CRM-1]|uniref:Uncharacterized protein n=3 Tax=Kryptosalinivirus TaxID=2560163 RepID=A0A2I6UG91_9CAUD|nr:hypothetical protein FGG63_gp46 [Salinibacter phage M8CC-19]YP_009639514.1 hypothetical protein FGG67_gp48 [Salinibacter phage M8CRM-1]AUO79004.1 hypothetical protein [Salinibacter phage M8CC-19]AUO79164.1 hypothetical protein [Salinibacter phage M8CRM-1]AUO79237.1 hypothetical protein [Salinibacter phage M31CC-1]
MIDLQAAMEDRRTGTIITDNEEAFETGVRYEVMGIEAETDKALCFATRSAEEVVWLPKSQVLCWERPDGKVEVFIERWLARKESNQLAEMI